MTRTVSVRRAFTRLMVVGLMVATAATAAWAAVGGPLTFAGATITRVFASAVNGAQLTIKWTTPAATVEFCDVVKNRDVYETAIRFEGKKVESITIVSCIDSAGNIFFTVLEVKPNRQDRPGQRRGQ